MSEAPKQSDIAAIKEQLKGPVYLGDYPESELKLFHIPTIAALVGEVERLRQALTGQDREIRRLNDEIDRYRSELGYEE